MLAGLESTDGCQAWPSHQGVPAAGPWVEGRCCQAGLQVVWPLSPQAASLRWGGARVPRRGTGRNLHFMPWCFEDRTSLAVPQHGLSWRHLKASTQSTNKNDVTAQLFHLNRS
ncbi:mCG147400 [Mus musculus]|nr:mCG147400 [Mus musculus]